MKEIITHTHTHTHTLHTSARTHTHTSKATSNVGVGGGGGNKITHRATLNTVLSMSIFKCHWSGTPIFLNNPGLLSKEGRFFVFKYCQITIVSVAETGSSSQIPEN